MIYDQHKKKGRDIRVLVLVHVKCFVTYQGESIPAQVTRTNKYVKYEYRYLLKALSSLMVYLALSSPQYCLFQEQNEK